MSEDLRNFINSCYERSEIGIARRNIFHDRMFKILFKFKDKMTDGELKEELIQTLNRSGKNLLEEAIQDLLKKYKKKSYDKK